MTNGRELAEIILVFADIDNVDPKRFGRLDTATITANYHDYITGICFPKIFFTLLNRLICTIYTTVYIVYMYTKEPIPYHENIISANIYIKSKINY